MSARAAALLLIASFASACVGFGAASAQMQAELPLDMVPPDAQAMAQEAAPDAAFYEADLEVGDEDGHNTIEIAGRDPQGRHVEVDLYEDGQSWAIEEIERHITWDETPLPVRQAIGSLMNTRWRPTLIERSQHGDGSIHYEIEGIDRYNEKFELETTDVGDFISLSKFNAS